MLNYVEYGKNKYDDDIFFQKIQSNESLTAGTSRVQENGKH